jgi:hypothetical protein
MTGGWIGGLRLVVVWLICSTAVPASATWFEARSRHFIVYSEGSPASIRKFASDLERFDQALRKLLRFSDIEGDDPNPVTVFTVDGLGTLNRLCKGGRGDAKICRYIGGWYSSRVSGSVAFVPRHAGTGPFALAAETILFHEYAHHLMLANSGATFPAWYLEGFAEFVSNAKLDREAEVGIGLPANSRAPSLYLQGGLPMAKLLTVNPSTLSAEQRALFYARAWLLTHYLTFSKEREGQLPGYLRAINSGVPADKAAEDAFGDLKKLDDELGGYLNRNKFHYLPVPVTPPPAEAIRIRQLDAGDAAMMPVRIQSDRGVDKATAQEVAEQARGIAAPYPDDPRVQDALAEAEFDAGNLDAAEAAVDRAMAKAPDDMTAMVYKAQILMQRAVQAKNHDEKDWKAVRGWLLRANSVETEAAWPLFLFYQSFRMQDIEPTHNAVAALERAYQLVPQDSSVRMTLVQQLMANDRLKEARAVLAPLAFNPHLPPGNSASALLMQIDERMKAAKDQPQPAKAEAR